MIRRNKKLIIIVLVLLVVGAVTAWVVAEKRDNKDEQDAKVSNTEGQLDRENRKAQKEEQNSNSQNGGSSATTKAAANPVLSRWGVLDTVVEAAGFVQGVYESGGVCTFRLTSGSSVVTRTSTSVKDATVTSCPPVQIPTSELTASKNWNIELIYDSSAASGTSSKQSLEL